MGRKKQFDEAEVLEKAMMTFWKNGYENTSVRTLEQEMGINQFSIYSTFVNKDELFRRVLENYSRKCDVEFLTNLRYEGSTIIDVEKFLKNFAGQILDGKIPNSCLMVQSVMHLDSRDEQLKRAIIKFFDSMNILFIKAIQNSIDSGLVSKTISVPQAADYLVGIAQSLSVFTKLKTKKAVMSYIDFSLQNLKTI